MSANSLIHNPYRYVILKDKFFCYIRMEMSAKIAGLFFDVLFLIVQKFCFLLLQQTRPFLLGFSTPFSLKTLIRICFHSIFFLLLKKLTFLAEMSTNALTHPPSYALTGNEKSQLNFFQQKCLRSKKYTQAILSYKYDKIFFISKQFGLRKPELKKKTFE